MVGAVVTIITAHSRAICVVEWWFWGHHRLPSLFDPFGNCVQQTMAVVVLALLPAMVQAGEYWTNNKINIGQQWRRRAHSSNINWYLMVNNFS